MEAQITLTSLWSLLLGGAGAVTVLASATKEIVKAIKAAKSPAENIEKRFTEIERRLKDAEDKLGNDHKRLTVIEEGMAAISTGQIALLDHGLSGNNVTQMEDAKKDILAYLAKK